MWKKIIESFSMTPRDVQTRPLLNREGRWFFVYVEKGEIYVDRAKEHHPSSNLSKRRKLSNSAGMCETMYDIYIRRKKGEPVSSEATATTANKVYWYGIFADMGY